MPPAAGTRASAATALKARATPANESVENPDSMVSGGDQEQLDPAQPQQLRSGGEDARDGNETTTASGDGRGTRSLSKFLGGARTPSSSSRGIRPSMRSRAIDDDIVQRLEDAERRMAAMHSKNEFLEAELHKLKSQRTKKGAQYERIHTWSCSSICIRFATLIRFSILTPQVHRHFSDMTFGCSKFWNSQHF